MVRGKDKRPPYLTIQVPDFDLRELRGRLSVRSDLDSEMVGVTLDTLNFSVEFSKRLRVRRTLLSAATKQKITAVVLLLRLIDLTESILVLATGRPQQELKSLFRIFLEAYFIFGNVCLDADFVPIYFQTDEVNRLRLLNAGERHSHELFENLNRYAKQGARAQLRERVKREGFKASEVYQYAEKIGCAHIYDSMYRITSAQVHTTPRCLESYVDADRNGNISKIGPRRDNETAQQVVYDTTVFLFKTLRGACELFGSRKVSSIEELEARLEAAARRLWPG